MTNNHFPFTFFALFWIGLGWLAVILAITSFFYMPILLIFIIAGIIFSIYQLLKNKEFLKNYFSKDLLFISVVTIIFICIFSYFSSPTIFSGRDQGALSEAAIRLAQNHQMEFSTPASQEFFKIYGPGKALNFPGFSYNEKGQLVSQFSVGYFSWLATFYSFFNIKGFIIANAISFFIFILSFFLFAKEIVSKKSAYIAVGLILTSFVFSWFFKFTLSENLALALLWFGIWQFVLFLKNNQRINFIFFLLSFGLLLFVRIETWAFLIIALVILAIKYRGNVLKVVGKLPIFIIIGIFIFYILGIFHNISFLVEPIKGFIKPFISPNNSSENNTVFWNEMGNTLKILWNYGLLDYVFFGLLGFLLTFKYKKIELAIPFLIILPSFIYLVAPTISSDQPWMLRRFVFSIIPISILYAIYFFESILSKQRIVYYLVLVSFFILNFSVFMPYLTFYPHQTLLAQTEKISQNFKSTDLVLVDRLATGDGWSMLTGPMNFLFGKQSVYFFNLEDLSKINKSKFSNVYFIIPDSNISFYDKISSSLIEQKEYSTENEVLFSKDTQPPIPQKIKTSGKIYLLQN